MVQPFAPLCLHRTRTALMLALIAVLATLGTAAQARPMPRAKHPSATALPQAVSESADEGDACPHRVVFHNRSSSGLQLRIGAELQRHLAKGITARLCTRAPRMRWQVTAPSGWQIGGDVDVRDLTVRDVVINDPDATLRVLNRSGEDQRLTLDGREVGTVKAGEDHDFGAIAPGDHQLLARGTHSNGWIPSQFFAKVGRTVRVDLRPPNTVADVYNTGADDAALRIDGFDYGELAAGASLRVVGLCGGRHEAVLIGKQTGEVQRTVLRVARAGERHRPSPPTQLTLVNAAGEVLDVPAGLARYAAQLDAGTQTRWTLPAGLTFGVTLTGRDSGLTYHFDVRGRDGGARTWRITRPKAMLRLVNRTGQEVAVLVPGHRVAHMDAGATATLRVPAGRALLVAHLGQDQHQLRTGLVLKPGADATWQIRSQETAVTVVNGYAETVQVVLDGAQPVEVKSQGDLRLDVQPGRHHLDVRARISHTEAAASFQIADGQLRKAYFDPPDGALRVDNGVGDAPVVLLARGKQLAEVPKGQAVAVDVLPGRLTAEVRDARSGRAQSWTGSIAPTEQVDLDPPPRAAVDLALENGGQRDLRVQLDAGEAHPIAAGQTWQIAGVAPGTHVLTMEVGGQVLRRRIDVDAQRALVRVRLREGR